METMNRQPAVTVFQAALGVPGRAMPRHPAARKAARKGEALFGEMGCASCHRPILKLRSRHYVKPSPFNPPGTFGDVSQSMSFDLTREGERPRRCTRPVYRPLVRFKVKRAADTAPA